MSNKLRLQLEDAETRASFGDICVISCTLEEDRTRQEFQADVDVNRIVKNIMGYQQNPVSYGNVDFDNLDRHMVENQLIAANELYASLTSEQRRVIPSVAHLIEMASQGYQPVVNPMSTKVDETPPVLA